MSDDPNGAQSFVGWMHISGRCISPLMYCSGRIVSETDGKANILNDVLANRNTPLPIWTVSHSQFRFGESFSPRCSTVT